MNYRREMQRDTTQTKENKILEIEHGIAGTTKKSKRFPTYITSSSTIQKREKI